MTTLIQLFNLYNFPPIRFIYWDISFKYPLNELEINEKGVVLKNSKSDDVFDKNFPKAYKYFYPHIVNIEINLEQDLREIAERYYLNIIKDNQYNENEINYIIENYLKLHIII
jgi:hypothetical protein